MKLSLKDRLQALVTGTVNNEELEEYKDKVKSMTGYVKEAKEVLSKGSYETPTGTVISGREHESTQRYDDYYTLYSELPGAKQAVAKIKDSVLSGGFFLEPPEESNKVYKPDDGFGRIMIEPNPQDTFEDILGGMLVNMKIYGNAYWELVKDESGSEVIEVWNLPAQDMGMILDEKEYMRGILKPIGYFRKITTLGIVKKIYYELDDIVHFKIDNPDGSIFGESVFQTNLAINQLVIASMRWNRAFFDNNARPDFEILLPETSNAVDARRYSKEFEYKFKGAGNAHKTLVHYGGAKSNPLGSRPKDVDFLEGTKYYTNLVVGGIGVPISLIGIMENTNRASAEVERRIFLAEKIRPLQKYIQGKIMRLIRDYFPEEDRTFQFGELDLQTDEQKAVINEKMLSHGVFNINEARRSLDKEEIEESWANEYTTWTAQGIIPVSEQIVSKGYFDKYETTKTKVLPKGKAIK